MKVCTACHETLPFECFYPDPRWLAKPTERDGFRAVCKRCAIKYQTEYAKRRKLKRKIALLTKAPM